MTIPVSTVIANVSTILNDVGFVHWTLPELLAWASEGETELVKKNPSAATKTITHQLVTGAKQSVPDDCITLVEVRQNENGSAVTPCDRSALDSFYPGWMTEPTSATVKHWMGDPQPDTFYVYPAQSATPAKVVLTYTFTPPALEEGGNLGVRDIYQSAIENYILYRAFSKDISAANAERAVAYAKAFYG